MIGADSHHTILRDIDVAVKSQDMMNPNTLSAGPASGLFGLTLGMMNQSNDNPSS